MVLPDSLSYQVVFDVSRQLPQDWWAFVIPLVIVTVLMRFGPRNRMNQNRLFKRMFVGFAIFLTLVFVVGTWATGCRLRRALLNGDVRVVEGTVTDFVPQRALYKHSEQFVVVTPTGRYKYSYSSSLGTGGLNKSRGRIRNGVRVRIADRDGVILRLEIARDAAGRTLSPELAGRYPEVVFLPVVYVRGGYTVSVPDTKGMSIRFVDVVSDTRRRAPYQPCSHCEESGDAIAIVEMFDSEVGRQPFRLELHTNRELYSPFTDGDLVVDLTGLSPVPSTDHPISKTDYIARIMIGRVQPPRDPRD
jgi:hypothetical protein